MVFNKDKKISKLFFSLNLLVIPLLIGSVIFLPGRSLAASARCFQTLVGGAKPTDCSSAPSFPIEGGSFKADHCYQTSTFGNSIIWKQSDCNALPFNTDKTAYGSISGNCFKESSDCDCNSTKLTKDNCGIIYYIWLFINFLSGLAGLILVISIIAAGIQWSTAGDNPQQISAAKTRIFNAIVAALLFIFTYAFLQWVVPGGIF